MGFNSGFKGLIFETHIYM